MTEEVNRSGAGRPITYGHTASPNNRAPYARHVVIVTSGKGGVGKSTVAVSLASALARSGSRVGLLDADVYGPSVPRMVSLEDERLVWDDDNRMVPAENFGIKVMSVGMTTPDQDTPLIWRSSVATAAMIQLLDDVAWGELDYLIVDMPPGTGDTQLTMAQELRISAAVVVTTPQAVATDDVARAIRMLRQIKAPVAGIVENMSWFTPPGSSERIPVFGSGGGAELARRYGLTLLAQVPLDPRIGAAADAGVPAPLAAGPEVAAWFEPVAARIRALLDGAPAAAGPL